MEKLKKKLEKSIEREVVERLTPVLDMLRQVHEEQRRTNELLSKILEALRRAEQGGV